MCRKQMAHPTGHCRCHCCARSLLLDTTRSLRPGPETHPNGTRPGLPFARDMTPISPFLTRSAVALGAGIALATVFVAVAPGTYYDTMELRLLDLREFGNESSAITPLLIVTNLLMAAFFFLIGKELWEALTIERSGLAGKSALVPGIASLGGMAGSALVWMVLSALIETAEEAAGAPGWTVPIGSDVVLAYVFARQLFGPGHPALQLLLFITLASDIASLGLAGLTLPNGETARLWWVAAAAVAPLAGWVFLTRPAARPEASERVRGRALAIWPWVSLGVLCWLAIAASGLPPAMGFLPMLPALPHASRSFGLFAAAEGFLTDPANRIAHWLRPAAVAILFLFGLTHGALDFGAIAPTTWIALGALWIGKPIGLTLGALLALQVFGLTRPRGVDIQDMVAVAAFASIGFTTPSLVMATALPGGAMQEAARIGLALSILAGPLTLLAFRAPRRRGAVPSPTREPDRN